MRNIYVPLPDDATDRLREMARRELRDPREQAAWLILDGLKRADHDDATGNTDVDPLRREVPIGPRR